MVCVCGWVICNEKNGRHVCAVGDPGRVVEWRRRAIDRGDADNRPLEAPFPRAILTVIAHWSFLSQLGGGYTRSGASCIVLDKDLCMILGHRGYTHSAWSVFDDCDTLARARSAASPERDAHGAASVRAADVVAVVVAAAARVVSPRGCGRGIADDADDGIGDDGDQRTPLVRGG